METEIWKDIVGYEGKYQVSNLWRIKKLKQQYRSREKILTSVFNNWYCKVNLYKKWNIKNVLVHRIVAIAFIKNTECKPYINHKNWIRNDNKIENLEWCTNSENQLHRFRILWWKSYLTWKYWKLHHLSKKIYQYSLEWNFIKTWDSMMDAQRELKTTHISEVCKWKRLSTKWFLFKYE